MRARAFGRRGDADRALACCDEALKLDTNSAEAHAARADALNGNCNDCHSKFRK